jgi:hypothetical protein
MTDAFTSGSVSAFAGTNGLRKALLDWCVGTAVASEALTGGGTSWGGTLSTTPVATGSLEVSYTIGGSPYTAQDDGAGNIVGTYITSGSITYSTGVYSITFSSSATGVTADYTSGNPGLDWDILMERDTVNDTGLENPFSGSEHKEVILRNRGLSGQEQVIVGLREWEYPGGNAYGWNLNVYTYFSEGMEWNANSVNHGRDAYNSTWNTWTELPTIPFVDDTIYYWFFSNRQRIVVVAKVQSNYESCYLGFGRRYSAPSKYGYPLVCKGSIYGTNNYSVTNDQRTGLARNDWDEDGYPLMVVNPGGEYVDSHGLTVWENGCKLLPMSVWDDSDVLIAAPTTGKVWAMPTMIARPSTNSLFMDLDGVVSLVGTGIQSEDLIRDNENGKKYLVFPDVYRSGHADFFGVVSDGEWTTTTTTV